MNFSFERCLQMICNKISLSDEDRKSYIKDAVGIQNYVMDLMKQNNVEFRSYFRGLSLTGSYLDDLKINTPDEFDLHVKLEFPGVRITPKKKSAALILLKTDSHHHLVDTDGYVNRVKLQSWMSKILENIFLNPVRCPLGQRTYTLKYRECGSGAVAHKICATEVSDRQREISFDFVPVFEFPQSEWCYPIKLQCDRSWFAVPPKCPNDARSFMVCAPHWEQQKLKDKQNLKDSLRLMKALRNANDLGRLTSYMLKSVYLVQIERRDERFWIRELNAVLIDMLHHLWECLGEGNLPFYWDTDRNHLDLIKNSDTLYHYKAKVEELLQKLRNLQRRQQVSYNEVAELFGVK